MVAHIPLNHLISKQSIQTTAVEDFNTTIHKDEENDDDVHYCIDDR